MEQDFSSCMLLMTALLLLVLWFLPCYLNCILKFLFCLWLLMSSKSIYLSVYACMCVYFEVSSALSTSWSLLNSGFARSATAVLQHCLIISLCFFNLSHEKRTCACGGQRAAGSLLHYSAFLTAWPWVQYCAAQCWPHDKGFSRCANIMCLCQLQRPSYWHSLQKKAPESGFFFPFFRSFPSSGKVFLVSAADRWLK